MILVIGKYKLLDNLIKVIILILGISTVIAVIVASSNNEINISFSQIIPNEMEGIIFLAAFMGWMQHPWIFLYGSQYGLKRN